MIYLIISASLLREAVSIAQLLHLNVKMKKKYILINVPVSLRHEHRANIHVDPQGKSHKCRTQK